MNPYALQTAMRFVTAAAFLFGFSTLPTVAARAASVQANPGIEGRLDLGVAIVQTPALPRYTASRTEGVTLLGNDARYSSLFARARWAVPWEFEALTLAGGVGLSLYPGNASLALAPPRGPDARYLAEYVAFARAEFEPVRSKHLAARTALGVALAGSRTDFTEVSIRTTEPRFQGDATLVFSGLEVFWPSLSPQLQVSGEAFPLGGSYRTVDAVDAARTNGANGPERLYGANRSGRVSGVSAEAALGVHYARLGATTPQQEGAVLVGVTLTNRTYHGFLEKREPATISGPGAVSTSDTAGTILGFSLSIQGTMP